MMLDIGCGWELIHEDTIERNRTYRMRVPGGWIVRIDQWRAGSCTFFPDKKHTWKVKPS